MEARRGGSLNGERMNSYSGVKKIVRFNWPWYAGAAVATVAAILFVYLNGSRGILLALVVAGLVFANAWMLLSLAVSHYVYDCSPVARGAWLQTVDATKIQRAAILHAGQNEASPVVARLLPSIEFQVFDFYDEQRTGTESLKRARSLNPHRDLAIRSDGIPLKDSTVDLALVVFAAHEIREVDDRAAFFREVNRVLSPRGRALVVEHLRDVWNFVAYGPGAFHFLSKRTWHESFANGGLKQLREHSCTPFVRVFELGKNL